MSGRTPMGPRAVLRLAPFDVRRLARDDLLPWLAAAPVAIVLACRFGAGPATTALAVRGVDVRGWLPLVGGAAFLVVLPTMIGAVVGFMLLQDKEDATWQAVRLTPLSLRGYLAWRALLASGGAAPATLLGLLLGGLAEVPSDAAVGLALASAPLAAATALGLGAFAPSTLEGVAAAKLGFVILVLPTVGLAAGGAWAWPLAAVVSWWPLRAYVAVLAGDPWLWWGLGAAALGGAITLACLRHAARASD